MKYKVIVDIKKLRQALDAPLQEIKAIGDDPAMLMLECDISELGEALLHSKGKLQESIMWLGMALKALGAPNPYPNSRNPENTIVDPTADNLKL